MLKFIYNLEDREEKNKIDNDELSYRDIVRRYETENYFLSIIENGRTDLLGNAYTEMSSSSANGNYSDKFPDNPLVLIATIRALARKAAEKGGLSVLTINEITRKAVKEMNNSDSYTEAYKILGEMLLKLTEGVKKHRSSQLNYSPLIKNVTEYIEYNLPGDLSLSKLAHAFQVSQSHLSREFKKETGKGLNEYITDARIHLAEEYLKNSDFSISEISKFTGIEDNNYFSKIFRKKTGKSPSDYRGSINQNS